MLAEAVDIYSRLFISDTKSCWHVASYEMEQPAFITRNCIVMGLCHSSKIAVRMPRIGPVIINNFDLALPNRPNQMLPTLLQSAIFFYNNIQLLDTVHCYFSLTSLLLE